MGRLPSVARRCRRGLPCPSPAVRPFFVFRSETPLFVSVFTSNVQIITTTCETSCLVLFSPVFRLSVVFALIRALSSVRFCLFTRLPSAPVFRPSVRFSAVLRLFALFLSFFAKIFFALWQVSVAVFKKTLQKSANFFSKPIAYSKKRRTFAIRKFIDSLKI